MITTASLSYDSREIVFALRRGGHVASNPVAHIEDISRYADEASNYHLFRINIDGTGLVQLTHGTHNNLDPCWLPDGGIGFISDRKPAYAYCYVVTSPVLYRMERDGLLVGEDITPPHGGKATRIYRAVRNPVAE